MKKITMRILFRSIVIITLFLIVYLWNYKKVTIDNPLTDVIAERLDILSNYENLEDLQFDSKGDLCVIYMNNSGNETLQTIPIGELDRNDVIIYSNGQICKVDSKSVALYDEKE